MADDILFVLCDGIFILRREGTVYDGLRLESLLDLLGRFFGDAIVTGSTGHIRGQVCNIISKDPLFIVDVAAHVVHLREVRQKEGPVK